MLLKTEKISRMLRLTLSAKGKENVLRAIRSLETRNDVRAVEPNYIIECAATTDPIQYSMADQWGLYHEQFGIQAQKAWNITTGSGSVVVGIVDSGIDSTHPALRNSIHRSSPHNIYTTLHRDYVDGSASNNYAIVDPVDPYYHGTHVAGIIGAKGNGSNAVSGVAPDVKLVSLRILDETGHSNYDRFTQAISYAQSAGIKVLNLSLGGDTYNSEEQKVVEDYSGLLICAAGNENRNSNLTTDTSPASLSILQASPMRISFP